MIELQADNSENCNRVCSSPDCGLRARSNGKLVL